MSYTPSMTPVLQITAPHFVAGAVVDVATQTITEAAPVIAYMLGWTVYRACAYCEAKRWRWVWVKGEFP